MAHAIVSIERGSIGDQCGIQPGDVLLSINGVPIIDQIDYQFFSAQENLVLEIEKADGIVEIQLEKEDWEPLGLTFAATMMSIPHHCKNHCVFCFVDQMPKGMRSSLYVKDDDWRLSLMMGNYITLTNLSDQEFERLIARRASPIHISVHATDSLVRTSIMQNPGAAHIMKQLTMLKDAGIQFHCQIVLCPGFNDGEALKQTVHDLASLLPSVLSVSIVPVGLTKYRENLPALTLFTKETAAAFLLQVHAWQREFLQIYGTRLIFAADEFYMLAQMPLPVEEAYERYPQIENGIGLLRRFEREYSAADHLLDDSETIPRRVVIACGVSAAPFFRVLLSEKPIQGVIVQVMAIENNFFGKNVTVSGLLVGQDLLCALQHVTADEILISDAMLREEDNVFLDDMPLETLQKALPAPLHPVPNDGAALLYALQGELYSQEG